MMFVSINKCCTAFHMFVFCANTMFTQPVVPGITFKLFYHIDWIYTTNETQPWVYLR